MSAVSIAALLASLLGATRLGHGTSVTLRQRTTVALAAAAGALWLEPVLTTLDYGQIDLVIAALVVCDLARPDRPRTKGTLIGLAAALKLTPGIFIIYLLLARRLRAFVFALASFAASVAVGLAFIPGDAARYWGGLAVDSSRVGRLQNPADQSLRGTIARLLHSTDIQATWIALAVVVTIVGLVLAAQAARRGDEATGFSVCALTGLLVSPISWTHHWAIAVPALLLGGVAAYHRRSIAGLVVIAAVTAIGYSHVTWGIPRNDAMRLGATGLIRADAYVLVALTALALASRAQLRSLDCLKSQTSAAQTTTAASTPPVDAAMMNP